MTRILIEAVPGRCLPVPGTRGRFYGLRRAPADAPPSAIVHSVEGGLSYVAEPTEVDLSTPGIAQYINRALVRGDIREAKPPAVVKSATRAREE